MGAVGALVVLVALAIAGSHIQQPRELSAEEWAPLAVALASVPLASVLLALRVVAGGEDGGD